MSNHAFFLRFPAITAVKLPGNQMFRVYTMKKLSVVVLLILPAALVLTAALFHYAQGPYWISYNSDPEYLYLLNSLALTEFRQTGTTGNPGTTLQILGAITLKISHALNLSGKDSLVFAVLRNPEYYLAVINIVLVTLNALLLFVLGLVTFHFTKSIWLSLLLQLSPFLSDAMLTNGLPRVSPEPLLLFTGLLFVWTLLTMAYDNTVSKSSHWYMIILALISGFGAATKLTFIPLLIIPLLVLPKLRHKIGFFFLTGLSFVLWTWPVASQYKALLSWYYKILTHTGYYGLGTPGITDAGIYLQNIMNMFLRNPLFFLILFLSAGFVLMFGLPFSGKEKAPKINPWQDIFFRILAAVTSAQLLAVLIVAKHYTDRYLLPVMSLSGFMLFLVFAYLRRVDYFSRVNMKKLAVIVGMMLVIGGAWRIVGIKNIFIQNLHIREEALAVNQILENEYKDYLKISIYRCSSPICALAFGNFYVNNALYSEALQKIYGDAYFFNGLNNGANGSFHTWTRVFPMDNIILSGHKDKIILQGSPPRYLGDTIASRAGLMLNLRDLFGGEYETIYAIAGFKITHETRRPLRSEILETTDFDFSTHPRQR